MCAGKKRAEAADQIKSFAREHERFWLADKSAPSGRAGPSQWPRQESLVEASWVEESSDKRDHHQHLSACSRQRRAPPTYFWPAPAELPKPKIGRPRAEAGAFVARAREVEAKSGTSEKVEEEKENK